MVFRAERGTFPTSWVSHLAVTDESGDRFLYGQRLEVGPQVDRSPRGPDGTPTGFDLSLTGADPSRSDDVPPRTLVDVRLGRSRSPESSDGS